MKQEIVICMDDEIVQKKVTYSKAEDCFLKELTLDESYIFLGILLVSAALNDNHWSTKLIFDVTFCDG